MIWVIINYLEGGEEEVGCYGVGKYFGEFVFIENKFRFVNVYVIGKVKVVFLECDFFEIFFGFMMFYFFFFIFWVIYSDLYYF